VITLTGGHIQDAGGIGIPNGSIALQLNVDATIIATPFGFVASANPVVFQFDSTGNLVQPVKIWSNEELNPQNEIGLGTYYMVTLYDANGARVNQVPMWWQFTEANGDTVDISALTPFATVGGNVIFYPTSFAIPDPTLISLGGVFANAGAANEFVISINTDGTVTLAQPSFSDISGTLSNAQLPSPLVFTTLTLSGLLTAEAGIQVGQVGTSGQIVFEGSTSGSASITAPAIAGTAANAFSFSNGINIPSGTAFSINTDAGISRSGAGIINVGNGTPGDASGTILCASVEGLTGQLTPNAAGGIAVGTTALPFASIWIGSTSAHNAQIAGTFTGNRVWTLQDSTDTIVGLATTDTLTNKTLTSPVINGTPSGTGIPTATVKNGSGAGNYSSTSTSYVNMDGTNLSYTVVIPTGWKLMIIGAAAVGCLTAPVSTLFAINDSVGGILTETTNLPTATLATDTRQVTLCGVITGDGLSHVVTLQYKTTNASDAVTAVNTTATLTPTMTFLLMPSH
jgi:hypothetical protein